MDDEFSNALHAVLPYTLSDSELLAIGKIIRGCAEIEDILSIHLCQMADISEGQLLILLGRANITSKLATAEQLAKAKGGAPWAAHQACFDTDAFKKLFRCRNAVAHGVLLGKSQDGMLIFRTSTAKSKTPDVVSIRAATFDPSDLDSFANIAREIVPQFDEILRTKRFRDERIL